MESSNGGRKALLSWHPGVRERIISGLLIIVKRETMAYFVYKVLPNKKLEMMASFEKYREARDHARELRKAISDEDSHVIKLIHARHQAEAERLLTTEREARPVGEE